MEENFNIQDSLNVIQSMIDQTKQKYEQNGLTLLVWGILVFGASIAQYSMIVSGNGEKSYLTWVVTMIPGFIITFIAKAINGAKAKLNKKSDDKMGYVWLMAGSMAMITGFILSRELGKAVTPMIWAPFCVAGLATGLYLKEKVFVAMSTVAAIIAFGSVFIDYQLQPVVTSFIALCLMVIPGIKLYKDHKKRQRV